MSSERTREADEVFCRHCGDAIKMQAEVCPYCGVRNEQYNRSIGQTSSSTDGFDRSADTTGGTGFDANVAAALSYVLGFVTGIAVYVLEDDRFVRFHAAQSMVVFGGLFVATAVVSAVFAAIGIGSIAALVSSLISLVGLGLWVFLLVTAYRGETYRVPLAADIADELVPGPGGVGRTPSGNGTNAGMATDTDALAALRTRYARGEIGEDEFERRLERLLESEHADDQRYERADVERSR
jgi:uncharacterized membrane protein